MRDLRAELEAEPLEYYRLFTPDPRCMGLVPPEEADVLMAYALWRDEHKTDAKLREGRNFLSTPSEWYAILRLLGPEAAARYLERDNWRVRDGGCDLVVADCRVDVKGVDYVENPVLMVREYEKGEAWYRCDVFLNVSVYHDDMLRPWQCALVGWVRKRKVFDKYPPLRRWGTKILSPHARCVPHWEQEPASELVLWNDVTS